VYFGTIIAGIALSAKIKRIFAPQSLTDPKAAKKPGSAESDDADFRHPGFYIVTSHYFFAFSFAIFLLIASSAFLRAVTTSTLPRIEGGRSSNGCQRR
jgi:hypothetical protein